MSERGLKSDTKEELEEEERRRREEEAEKRKRKLRTIAFKKREGKIEVFSYKEEPTTIPLIKLDKVLVLPRKKLELSKETPKIEKEKRIVSLPVLDLQAVSIMLRERELDCQIPKIEKSRKMLTVPVIRVRSVPTISILLTKFDAEIRKPAPPSRLKIRVPLYRKALLSLPKLLLESFNLTVNEQLKNRLEKEVEKILVGIEVEKVEAGAPSVGAEEEEVPDFLEFMYGISGRTIRSRGPKIILFKDLEDDSYINTLETLCLRIYREKEGGEPKAKQISKIDEMNKREIEKWLDVGHTIFTINLDRQEGNRRPWLEIDEDLLKDRLDETYTERIGFIIFVTRREETFNHYKELLERINLRAQGRLNIITMRARKLPRRLVSLIWGKIISDIPQMDNIRMIDKRDGTPIVTTFDYLFNKGRKLFNEFLDRVKEEERGLFKSATRRNWRQLEGKKSESDLHYNIKVFLVRYLVHELRKRGVDLKTREEIIRVIRTEDGKANPVPDIQINSEVYEVETLFGEGENADKKIDETIDKYEGTDIRRVNIVMDNLGFLLHLRDLKEKEALFKDKTFEVKFYTLDLKNKKLISLTDFIKELKSTWSELK